jgi:hypothetical protein
MLPERSKSRLILKTMHLLEQTKCQYVSDFEQENNECEAVLEQQQAGKFISDCKSNSSTFTECLKDRHKPEVYNQFEIQVKPMITDDCIGNYIFS